VIRNSALQTIAASPPVTRSEIFSPFNFFFFPLLPRKSKLFLKAFFSSHIFVKRQAYPRLPFEIRSFQKKRMIVEFLRLEWSFTNPLSGVISFLKKQVRLLFSHILESPSFINCPLPQIPFFSLSSGSIYCPIYLSCPPPPPEVFFSSPMVKQDAFF